MRAGVGFSSEREALSMASASEMRPASRVWGRGPGYRKVLSSTSGTSVSWALSSSAKARQWSLLAMAR